MAGGRGKMREHRLQWFGLVIRQDEKDLIMVIQGRRVEGRQCKSRPKLTWELVIHADMIAYGLHGTLDEDRRHGRWHFIDPPLPRAGFGVSVM